MIGWYSLLNPSLFIVHTTKHNVQFQYNSDWIKIWLESIRLSCQCCSPLTWCKCAPHIMRRLYQQQKASYLRDHTETGEYKQLRTEIIGGISSANTDPFLRCCWLILVKLLVWYHMNLLSLFSLMSKASCYIDIHLILDHILKKKITFLWLQKKKIDH